MGQREGNLILVMAGDIKQAEDWARRRNLSKADWVYGGSTIDNFTGLHFNRFAIIGTFWDRDDAGQLFSHMEMRLEVDAKRVH